jgi:hypothetical protein
MNLIDFTTIDLRPLLGAVVLLLVMLSILREQQRINREKEMLDRMAHRQSGRDLVSGRSPRQRGGRWQSRGPDQDTSAS